MLFVHPRRYVTDTREGSVYRLNPENNILRRIAPQHTFTAANGIAFSPDGKLLYVSAWGDGIVAINLQTGSVEPVRHPDRIGLSFISGLYCVAGSLVAIQNGPMLPRVTQFKLNRRGTQVYRDDRS